jgi:phage tail sheath gpL-like
MASTAVPLQWVSRIVGYLLTKGSFQATSPNLPQSIAVFGEANDDNQSGLDLTPTSFTSAQAIGLKYGFGSPLHIMARILFPNNGGGVSGIPVTVYPQAKAVGATPKTFTISPSGVATASGTHYINIAGREGLDGQFYAINIAQGDTASDIVSKIYDTVNGVLGCPMICTDTEYVATLQSKWSGATADKLSVSIDTQGNSLGISYEITATSTASGTPDITSQLNFGNVWNTIVVNPYDTNTTVMAALENYNGIPDPVNPTGRYVGIIMQPFIAITGNTDDDPSYLTSGRNNQVTIAIAPAPNSLGLPMEASANATVLFANLSQNTPELDIGGLSYPDMPTPISAGSMQDATNRNSIVQNGSSTANVINGVYVIQDFVTTYNPVGENPPQYRYARNLMLDFNVRYSYYLKEQLYVIGSVIANDDDVVKSSKVIKPKTWKSAVADLADDLVSRGLLVDAAFMKAGIVVNISTTNPDRLETFFPYKRSGVARIAATTAQAGFNFGTLN